MVTTKSLFLFSASLLRTSNLCALATSLNPPPTTVYTYTGHEYASCSGTYCTGGPHALRVRFLTTLTGNGLHNLSFTDITPTITSFAFTDGSGPTVDEHTIGGSTSVSISTDASGNIVSWLIGGYAASTNVQMQTNWDSPFSFIPGADFSETTAFFAGSYGLIGNDPGTWAIARTFSGTYHDPNGYKDLRSVQMLFAATPDGGGQSFCFVHYDVRGDGLWLYRDDVGFFVGPIRPGTASSELQGTFCAISTQASSVAASGNTLTLNINVVFKAAGARNIYLRAQDLAGHETGWIEQGTWTLAAAALGTPSVSPNSGSSVTGSSQTFTLTYPDAPGFESLALGWEQLLIATSSTGGGDPFCSCTTIGGQRSVDVFQRRGFLRRAGGPWNGIECLGKQRVFGEYCRYDGDEHERETGADGAGHHESADGGSKEYIPASAGRPEPGHRVSTGRDLDGQLRRELEGRKITGCNGGRRKGSGLGPVLRIAGCFWPNLSQTYGWS